MRRVRLGALALLAASLLPLVVACSDDGGDDGGDGGAASPASFVPQVCASEEPVLRVDLIDDAVAAVEAERGGAQRYYEINATDRLVNLFVAGDADGEVVPYVFLGGELSAEEPSTGAAGSTFVAVSLDFDPLRVTSCVAADLDPATFVAFEVVGGPGGTVRYSVINRSLSGGRLISVVDRTGAITAVQTVG